MIWNSECAIELDRSYLYFYPMQEEPLPHELRPIGVLQMTMDYLVTMVMDTGGDRRGDWYDFVWNRTRAIRKVYMPNLCVKFRSYCDQ